MWWTVARSAAVRLPAACSRSASSARGGRSFVDGTQSDLLMHDGSLLSGISSAIQLGGKILMGSANSPGLLLCDVPHTV